MLGKHTSTQARVQVDSKTSDVPAFQFSTLTCLPGCYATKIFYPDREIGYSNAKYFHYTHHEIEFLEDFAKVCLEWLADEPKRFIIRGQLKPGLKGKQLRRIHDHPGEPATIECPSRRWIVLDVDGAPVPEGLGAPDKVAEAGYYIRDNLLPPYFRGARCIAAATASTGKKTDKARLRLYFALSEAADNNDLHLWVQRLSAKCLWIDPAPMQAHQPIYTARPVFRGGLKDPVPAWSRVRLLDGHEDSLDLDKLELSRVPKRKKHKTSIFDPPQVTLCHGLPDWLSEATEQDAGMGVSPITDISEKAWKAIKQIFELLDGCPKIYGGEPMGRHAALNVTAYWLARLSAEGELSKKKAWEAFFRAVKGINNSDGRYHPILIKRHLKDAFADVGGMK